jgi:superfamily II DNA/RNA helicase
VLAAPDAVSSCRRLPDTLSCRAHRLPPSSRASRRPGHGPRSWSHPISSPHTSPALPHARTTETFGSLGVPEVLVEQLTADGITSPFPIQAATLPDALAGRDVLGRGRTGSGKTLAFLLPLVTRLSTLPAARAGRPTGLVLAPTRELATQINAVLQPLAKAAGLRTLTVFGGVPSGKQVRGLKAGVDIVVACPGRLQDLINQGHAVLSDVRITVLDEADHMADLGFLPVVRRLLDTTPQDGQRLLFSATLDRGVDVLVKRYLSQPVVHEVDTASSPVVTMTHHVLHVTRDDRLPVVADLAAAPGRTVVFTRTKRGAKTLARQLRTRGIHAVELHGNLAQNARTRNLAEFSAGRATALVATDIAARGIHVDDVTLVVHADPPMEHKAYLHRSGRTARAGEAGTVVTIMLADQVSAVRDLMRRAGIKATTSKVTAEHALLRSIAPGDRDYGHVETAPAPAAPARGDRRPARSGTPRRPSANGAGRSRGRGRSTGNRPHSAAGFSAGSRGR